MLLIFFTTNFSVMKRLFLFSLLLFFTGFLFAQPPKREMRAAWVTTVWGLDWPQGLTIPATGSTYHINEQKKMFIRLIDSLKSANMNTIFFQVRSECDAFYRSSYEPWSSNLVSTRGMDPGYDPLEFVIQESHKRGIEVHAWLNPYRFESVVGKYKDKAGDYRLTHPEWVLEYPNKSDGSKNVSILDPGNPGVRAQIVNIVREIVTNYDVDGITFDDYFYAYGGTPDALDAYAQGLYKPSGMNLHDWRRANVNQMVADVYRMIQSVKPYITFGVSPFGIWTTDVTVAAKEGIELPAGITGGNMYAEIYCDPVAWLKEATVDYISPQLYWPTTSTGQDYKKLAPWWSNLCQRFNRHLYVSHTLSSLDASSYVSPFGLKSAANVAQDINFNGLSMMEYYSVSSNGNLKAAAGYAPTEFGLQIQWNRSSDRNDAPGSVFFRAAQFYTQGFINYLKQYEFANLALRPTLAWKPYVQRHLPSNLAISGSQLSWSCPEEGVRYVVYAIPSSVANQLGNFSKSDYILGVSYDKTFDLSKYAGMISTHRFAVSVLDRYGYEFPPVLMGHSSSANQSAVLNYPSNNQGVSIPFAFKWNAVDGAESYVLELATDNQFVSPLYYRPVLSNSFSSVDLNLEVGKSYFWRVRTRKIGVLDAVSEVRQFTVDNKLSPSVVSPANNETGVSVTPQLSWVDLGSDYRYQIQISGSSTFSTVLYSQDNLTGTTLQLPLGVLNTYSTYYVRIKGWLGEVATAWSDVVKFSTLQAPPEIPVILSPTEGESVATNPVVIRWKANPLAKAFRVQLSTDPSFPIRLSTSKSVGAGVYEVGYPNVAPGVYYVRMEAQYGVSSTTGWSSVVSFKFLTTGVDDQEITKLSLECASPLNPVAATVRYTLADRSQVRLYITDLTGRVVRVLDQGEKNTAVHTVKFETGGLNRGLYFIVLEYGSGRQVLKVIK